MNTGHRPNPPRCTLAKFIPTTLDTDEVKRDGWNDHRILVVSAGDSRLTWIERQVIEAIGKRLYGRQSRG